MAPHIQYVHHHYHHHHFAFLIGQFRQAIRTEIKTARDRAQKKKPDNGRRPGSSWTSDYIIVQRIRRTSCSRDVQSGLPVGLCIAQRSEHGASIDLNQVHLLHITTLPPPVHTSNASTP